VLEADLINLPLNCYNQLQNPIGSRKANEISLYYLFNCLIFVFCFVFTYANRVVYSGNLKLAKNKIKEKRTHNSFIEFEISLSKDPE